MTVEQRVQPPEGIRLLKSTRGFVPPFPYAAIDLGQNRPTTAAVQDVLREHVLGGDSSDSMKFVVAEGRTGPVLYVCPKIAVNTDQKPYGVNHTDLAGLTYDVRAEERPKLLAAGHISFGQDGSLSFAAGSITLEDRISFEASQRYVNENLSPTFSTTG